MGAFSVLITGLVAALSTIAVLYLRSDIYFHPESSMSEILSSISSHLGMGHKYKLFYFDAAGRAEPTRWVFAYAGQEYEDIRIQKADWPAQKSHAPNGQLPYLEVDGKPLAQSIAIARFVARKHGLVGKDDFEAAQADALVDYVTDASKGLMAVFAESDEAKKTLIKQNFVKVGVQPFLKGFERHLQANHNGEGFFVGSKPTWADFTVVIFLDGLVRIDNTVLDDYKLLKAHSQRVHDLKGIKEWLMKRPVSDF